MFYDDDLGIENIFFPVCLIREYASVTINVYLYSIHLGIWNVTAVFQFPFNTAEAPGLNGLQGRVNYESVCGSAWSFLTRFFQLHFKHAFSKKT